MKKIYLVLVVIMCAMYFGACGVENNEHLSKDEATEKYMVYWSEREELVLPEETNRKLTLLGVQYYFKEVILLYGERMTDEQGKTVLDVYCWHQNGTLELMLQGIPESYFRRNGWFISEEQEFYILFDNEIVKLGKDGTEKYRNQVVGGIFDICQLSEDKLVLLLGEEKGMVHLAELNAADGEISVKENIFLGEDRSQYISSGENGLLLLNGEGIWEIQLRNGSKECIQSFEEVSYQYSNGVMDFCVGEKGNVDLLRVGVVEHLRVVDIYQDREVIRLRDYYKDEVLENWVKWFNEENETYFVIYELGHKEGTDIREYREQTDIEVSTGKGPDILCSDVVSSSYAWLEKGVFADLKPYMDAAGISETQYFPAAFDVWRDGDKIYGVNLKVYPIGDWVDERLVQNCDTLNIESYVDALYQYTDKAMYNGYWEADRILEEFLCGSEDLWGMVDWEKNSCDFSGALFAKMLEVAKRYGKIEGKNYPVISGPRFMDGYYDFDRKEQLESEGKEYIGLFFDDGCHTQMNAYSTLAINSNSSNQEGAWEFLEFLLSEEVQSTVSFNEFPVNRQAYDNVVCREMEEGAVATVLVNGVSSVRWKKMFPTVEEAYAAREMGVEEYRRLYDLTAETAEEIRKTLEDTKAVPIRAKALLAIIQEEAEAYFANVKAIDEVIPIIENRVQLYLDELNE